MQASNRPVPNILITGTPGVGKSTVCREVAQRTGLTWIDISKVANDNHCLEAYDDVYKCPILDEDKLLDGLEVQMSCGGNIVDYHSCEFFPERWFDAVIVLRTNNTILYDRLKARGYEGKKLEDNVQCEIFQTILEEARNSYDPRIVHEFDNSEMDKIEDNVYRILTILENWMNPNA